ncbi:HNH endonuclease signature motif containing protein [Streptomyces sp. NPDC048242]|uniref:HNH endonuclease n=1 Tax=Streptomyces sp. NPDC048242 TaxID=3155026 RepID=UPI00343FEDB9
MAWATSNRRKRLPANWEKLRQRVIRRAGGRCQAALLDTGQRCDYPGTDVDHIVRGDDHALTNLQLLCRWHHKEKTQAESAAARALKPRPRTRIARAEQETVPDAW